MANGNIAPSTLARGEIAWLSQLEAN